MLRYWNNHLSKSLFSRVSTHGTARLYFFSWFVLIAIANLLGINPFSQQMLISRSSLTIFLSVIVLWIISYLQPIKVKGMIGLSQLVVVNISLPPLSLLISSIELITHLFRPITLLSRIWVNLWVGHLLLTVCSYLILLSVPTLRLGITMFSRFLASMVISVIFIYEIGVSLLQSLVLVYLSALYYKDNRNVN